jgi:hypothetical protein
MKKEGHLTGAETEAWVKEFAQKTYVLSKIEYPVEKLIHLLERNLSHRFKNGRMYIYKDLPEGNDWIESALNGKSLHSIGKQNKEELSTYLLDKVVATDLIVELRDNHSTLHKISIDVTIDNTKEDEKLGRLRGKPEKSDSPGYNQNSNLPFIRKELGINKHIVLTLNSDRSKLPSYECLLTELYAFANAKAQTRAVNLLEVPENQRFNWNEPEQLASRQLWEKYRRGIQSPDPIEQGVQASIKALRAGYNPIIVSDMLKQHPQYSRLSKNNPAAANNFLQYALTEASKRIEQQQLKTVPSSNQINEQRNLNERAMKCCSWLASTLGKANTEGYKVFKTEKLSITLGKNFLRVDSGDKKILELNNRKLSGTISSHEVEKLEAVTNNAKQRIRQQASKGMRRSIQQQKGNELEP